METFCHIGDREKLRRIHALVTDVAAKDTYTPFIDVLISGARPSDGRGHRPNPGASGFASGHASVFPSLRPPTLLCSPSLGPVPRFSMA